MKHASVVSASVLSQLLKKTFFLFGVKKKRLLFLEVVSGLHFKLSLFVCFSNLITQHGLTLSRVFKCRFPEIFVAAAEEFSIRTIHSNNKFNASTPKDVTLAWDTSSCQATPQRKTKTLTRKCTHPPPPSPHAPLRLQHINVILMGSSNPIKHLLPT